MWVDMELQGQGDNLANMDYDYTSQLEQRKREARCVEASSLNQGLNPGRSCSNSTQCRSNLCYNKICVGLNEGQGCAEHSDCNSGLFCSDQLEWPLASICKPLIEDGDKCKEDYECQIDSFCWYATSLDRQNDTKKCMQKYSQDNGHEFGWQKTEFLTDHVDQKVENNFKVYERNGLYCKSGLAVQVPSSPNTARCVKTESINFDGKPVDYPYPCKPTDPSKKCQIVYSLDQSDGLGEFEGKIESDCVCALFEDNLGFCETVIGTETYEKAK